MKTSEMTPAEVRKAAYEAIVKALGPSGLIRFLQETSVGSGDYTRERRTHLPEKPVREVVEDVRKDNLGHSQMRDGK